MKRFFRLIEETEPMRLIPVLDLQNGIVVSGIGGRRSEYLPLVSRLTASTKPDNVLRSLIENYRPGEVYVADLDAIGGRQASWPQLAISDFGAALWIDAGIRSERDVEPLAKAKVAGIVIGLETVNGPDVLEAAISATGADRVVFSLDFRDGHMLGSWNRWQAQNDGDWNTVVSRVVRTGVRRIILLDLFRVGEGRGTGTETMCSAIAAEYPSLEIICGGGVRDVDDLLRLQDCGASAALVASALHDDRIKPGDWPPQV